MGNLSVQECLKFLIFFSHYIHSANLFPFNKVVQFYAFFHICPCWFCLLSFNCLLLYILLAFSKANIMQPIHVKQWVSTL